MTKLIYLAAPYTHPVGEVRKERLKAVGAYALKLMSRKLLPFSPVLHCEPIERLLAVPGDFKTWEWYCQKMLRRADAMHVLKLDGWKTSVGVQAEMDLAFELQIPVMLVDV